ncbi:hypothetical protein BH09BAC6_BH09BAC6_07810 [soil metagenome]|jgi:hypothetical protein
MDSNLSFWQRIGIQDFFLKNNGVKSKAPEVLTPNIVFKYIVDKFKESISELSFADRVVFYHEYIICFNKDDYRMFMENKKGIFGLISQETVKKFYEILKQYHADQKTVEPSSNKWVFRFVTHPDYAPGDKGFIGKLIPDSNQKDENLKVTFIPRQTGLAQTFDVDDDTLKGFIFYSEGYYEIPYVSELNLDDKNFLQPVQQAIARFETTIPDKAYAGKKLEYLMRMEEIIISGSDETREDDGIFRIPSEWVSTPHLQIRYNRTDSKFYVTSFGERTLLNENVVEPSDINAPVWTELPLNSKMILNGIIGISIFKG